MVILTFKIFSFNYISKFTNKKYWSLTYVSGAGKIGAFKISNYIKLLHVWLKAVNIVCMQTQYMYHH